MGWLRSLEDDRQGGCIRLDRQLHQPAAVPWLGGHEPPRCATSCFAVWTKACVTPWFPRRPLNTLRLHLQLLPVTKRWLSHDLCSICQAGQPIITKCHRSKCVGFANKPACFSAAAMLQLGCVNSARTKHPCKRTCAAWFKDHESGS